MGVSKNRGARLDGTADLAEGWPLEWLHLSAWTRAVVDLLVAMQSRAVRPPKGSKAKQKVRGPFALLT